MEKMEDDCSIELFKLQKLFEGSFKIRDDEIKGDLSVSFILKPTDPDFNLSLLSPLEGIKLSLKLHECSLDKEAEDGADDLSIFRGSNKESHYELKDISDVVIENSNLSAEFKRIIQKVLFDYVNKNRKIKKYIIYEGLKFLDKNLVQLFNITKTLQSNKEETPWTLEEQKCLEDGLVKSKNIQEPKEKWSFISKIVKTKTPEECKRRFIRCRNSIKNKEEKNAVSNEKPPDDSSPSERMTEKNYPLLIRELEMSKISIAKISSFTIELLCIRCGSGFEANLIDRNEKLMIFNKSCEKCSITNRCEFQHSVVFNTQSSIGNISLLNSNYKDFISGEFILTCEDCDTQCKIRDVKMCTKKTLSCRGCFAKFNFGIGSIEIQDNTAAIPEVIKKVIKHEVKRSALGTGGKGIKIGTPLPLNGTCKHYKKSFRWFRFPCCSRLFPCDVCHDDASNHKCGHANVIVCGHCSTQQPASNKLCKYCNKTYTSGASAHWEGGKGCRDPTKLSRKDSKKYKMIIRQTNIKK